jgi:hypothetical protein
MGEREYDTACASPPTSHIVEGMIQIKDVALCSPKIPVIAFLFTVDQRFGSFLTDSGFI